MTADIANSELTTAELETARSYLSRTRALLCQATTSLSPSQWSFQPRPACWSIAQITEHQVLTERAIHQTVETISGAPAAPEGWDPSHFDAFIPVHIPDRSIKAKSPHFLIPIGAWTIDDAIQRFLAAREHTIDLLFAPALRSHVIPHPVFGPWDGYHWLLAIGAHGERHTRQILEVKADPGFPVDPG